MVINYVNSKWSMPRRLALISMVFLIPSMVQLYIYASEKLAQIHEISSEIDGATLAKAVWADLGSESQGIATGSDSAVTKAISGGSNTFGIENSLIQYVAVNGDVATAAAAINMFDEIGNKSLLMFDNDMDTQHAQDIFLQRLPLLFRALAIVRHDLNTDAANQNTLLTHYGSLSDAADNLLKPYNDLMQDDKTGDATKSLEESTKRLKAQIEVIKSKISASANKTELASTLPAEITAAMATVLGLADKTTDLFTRLADVHRADDRRTLYETLGLLIAATIGAVVIVMAISRGVTSRLGNVVKCMEQLSRKELAVDIPHQSDANENGAMARALGRFKEALVENGKLTDETVENAKKQKEMSDYYGREHERFMEAFMQAAGRISRGNFAEHIKESTIQEYQPILNQMNSMMGQLEAARIAKVASEEQVNLVVESLGTALAELAEGHLETSVDADVAPEFAQLKADFNSAAAQLRSTIELVKKSAGSIKLGTDEISQASDDLSRRTENQAASLEQTAAAVKEITDTVNKTAHSATQARQTVSNAKADAEKGGEVVGKAVAAMNGIETSSRQISQIISVIDEIAFQTNLLALNAGVEAARAGDAGRGFAVVASEVRALAQRSAEAAKEIKSLISASTAQVAQGVVLVGETGEALRRIVARVAEINTIVTGIAASATEQAHGLEQVNTAVNEMDQVTQQNAAMVEESTAATQTLAQQTEELSQLVSRFRTGHDSVVEMAPRREPARAAAPARRPAAKLAAGGGARKAAAASADASWEEF